MSHELLGVIAGGKKRTPPGTILLNHFESLSGSDARSAVGPNLVAENGATIGAPAIYQSSGFSADGTSIKAWGATFGDTEVLITPSTNWAVEFSIRPAASLQNGSLIRIRDPGLNDLFTVSLVNGRLEATSQYPNGAGQFWGVSTYSSGVTYRIGFQWNPATAAMDLYVNGSFVQASLVTGAAGTGSYIKQVIIGRGRPTGTTNPMNGTFDELLLVVGSALYPTGLTPPYSPTTP